LWDDEVAATVAPSAATVSGPSDTGGTEGPGQAQNEVPRKLFEAVALVDYNTDAGIDGYATLRKGDKVLVFYEGTSDEECGWFYGYSPGEGKGGWFPGDAIERLGTPP
jgi:hypothetical protein